MAPPGRNAASINCGTSLSQMGIPPPAVAKAPSDPSGGVFYFQITRVEIRSRACKQRP